MTINTLTFGVGETKANRNMRTQRRPVSQSWCYYQVWTLSTEQTALVEVKLNQSLEEVQYLHETTIKLSLYIYTVCSVIMWIQPRSFSCCWGAFLCVLGESQETPCEYQTAQREAALGLPSSSSSPPRRRRRSRNCRLMGLAGHSRVLVSGFTMVPAGSPLNS